MKNVVLTIFFALVTTQLAFGQTATFRIGATIPRIQGVNYFPEDADIAPAQDQTQLPKMTTEKLVLRNGEEVLLRTNVVK